MDPLSSLGLVANIVQLVGAATTAYKVCREIHQSGASVEDSRLSYTTSQLHGSYVALTHSIQISSNASVNNVRNGVHLDDLGSRCCKTAVALQTILDSLRKSPGRDIRESISKFAQRLRKAGTIEGLKKELDEYQKALDSMILIGIGEDLKISEIRRQAHDVGVEQQLRQLAKKLETCNSQSSDELKAGIDRIFKFDETQHALTRQQAKRNITDAMQDLERSRDQHYHEQQMEQKRHLQRDQVIKSLMFEEINSRMNDVSEPHLKTFEWIFDDTAEQPWDSFAQWLVEGESIFWINGKAGSGKSTLLKFMAGNQKSRKLLTQWSPDSKVLIVTYYLWLSGSKMQRSLKGLLCSFIRQILLHDERVFEKFVRNDDSLLLKYTVHDWSNETLKQTLRSVTKLSCHPICLFIDGLDEFDREGNVHGLLDFLIELCIPKKVKICASSRPEQHLLKRLRGYRQLQLQDLTTEDIETCIRDELEKACTKCAPSFFSVSDQKYIMRIMKEKANGVFLWVHFALNSLLRGLGNEDDFGMLVSRITTLPSEMHDLYLHMWKRLNGDEKFYLEEATTFFSYDKHYPMSLFELRVVLDKPLQASYINDLKSQDSKILVEDCNLLLTRVITRCAGLLELGWRTPDRNDHEDPLFSYYSAWEVRYLHRTARDFLFTTVAGQNLVGIPTKTDESRLQDVVNANLAAVVQGLSPLDARSLQFLVCKVKRCSPRNEIDLLVSIKRTYQKLGMPDNTGKTWLQSKREGFWGGCKYAHFECIAAYNECNDYIQHFIKNEITYASPYYCGLLALCEVMGTPETLVERHETTFSLVSWLGARGADLCTSHVSSGLTLTPLGEFFCSVLAYTRLEDVQWVKRDVETLQTLLSHGKGFVGDCMVRVSPRNRWRVLSGNSPPKPADIIVRISLIKLCKLAMEYVEGPFSLRPQWRIPSICGEDVSEVLFRIDIIVEDRMVDLETWGSAKGHTFTSTDSIHLGQALDQIIFYNQNSMKSRDEMIEIFENQLREAGQRGQEFWFDEWQVKVGWKVPVADQVSICTLDPAEDVDETNWRERGYFRHIAAQSKSRDAETASESSESAADEDLLAELSGSDMAVD